MMSLMLSTIMIATLTQIWIDIHECASVQVNDMLMK